jgi:hypothetical protein
VLTWISRVPPEWLAVATVTLAALSFLAMACLAWGGRIHARELAKVSRELGSLRGDVALARAGLDETQDDVRKQTARIDRMQRDDKRRGWGDSLDLTRFNWRRPPPF